MDQLLLTTADLAELGQFMHANFRGTERELLTRWLNGKLESQRTLAARTRIDAMPKPSVAAMDAASNGAATKPEEPPASVTNIRKPRRKTA